MSIAVPLRLTMGQRWAAVLLPLVLLALWEGSGLDLPSMRLYADAQGFRLKEHWFTSQLLHEGGRGLGWVVLLSLVWAAWRPFAHGPTRSERWWTLATILFCLLAVPAFKRWSLTSCPWDLREFGGQAAYVSHWLRGVADGGPGRCFPSGHAVAAFGFLPQAVLWARYDRRRAGLWLAGILILGTGFAWAQTARGAHYPSHSMWSATLCWLVAVLAERWIPAAPTGRGF